MNEASGGRRSAWNLAQQPDVMLAIAVIGILGIMIVPMPTFLLDLLLTFNVTFSLIVLVNALYVTAPLQLSVFPSLMLVVTLFRLALNVASTRLILGQAYAGEMISAFGSFVVKDNYIVGFVIFVILVAIQYLVIVRGTERNAEVGARFTLDAMPGKQMSIDADLNAGLINEEEAMRRRSEITREANFYGAMDGAAKFVRGDAIAGIVITLVNILAGFAVGMLQMGMSPGESLRTYTQLTIGDGLVSQIPALIISTSAGIVVSRAAGASSLGTEIGKELFSHRKPLFIVAGALGVLALVPGIPTFPLLLLGSGVMVLGRVSPRPEPTEETATATPPSAREAPPEDYLKVDRLEVAIGYALIPLMDAEGGSDFLDRAVAMRRQLASEVGILVPRIRVRDDIRLKADEYQIRIRGHRVASGALRVGHHLAMGSGESLDQIEGGETKEPAFGLRAKWISTAGKGQAQDLGLTVVGASVVLSTHLTEIIKSHAWEILTRQDTQFLLDELKKDSPAIVQDVVPQVVTLGTVHRVLQNLLKERVPIRDLGTILETLGDYASQVKEVDLLTEYVRAALSRAISDGCAGTPGRLQAISLDPQLEHTLAQAARDGGQSLGTLLSPAETQRLLKRLETMVKSILDRQERPAVLCAPQVRLLVRRLTEASFPTLPVLSYHEIAPDVDVYSVGVLALDDETRARGQNETPMKEAAPITA